MLKIQFFLNNIKNAEFYDNTMNEQLRKSSTAYTHNIYSNKTICTYDGNNLIINIEVKDEEIAKKMIKQILPDFTNVTKNFENENENKIINKKIEKSKKEEEEQQSEVEDEIIELN